MKTKMCRKCGRKLPLSEFYLAKARKKYAYRNACKQCEKERAAAWRRDNRKLWLQCMRRHSLKRDFGITPEQYEQMLTDQDGGCAICGGQNIANKRLAVDHNHVTGEVRGLLCHHCNAAIGHVEENVSRLLRMIAYIKEHEQVV